MSIWIAYQQAIDTGSMKPTWTGSYVLKGDSMIYIMQPDVYKEVQKGNGLYSLPYNQMPGAM